VTIERRKTELDLVSSQYGEIEVGADQDWFVIKHWTLAAGWNKDETAVLVLIPPGYPVTPPDNFYTDNALRVEGGGLPGSTSADQAQQGRQWLQFSYHVEDGEWHPHADPLKGDNLLTFLLAVGKRLSEAN